MAFYAACITGGYQPDIILVGRYKYLKIALMRGLPITVSSAYASLMVSRFIGALVSILYFL